jgi:ketosteroid isomerase-like protein
VTEANADVVREIYAGWARGDFGVGIEHFHPDIEFVSELGVDQVTARGREGMRDAWRDQLRNWERWRTSEILELREVGDRVLVVNAVRGRGRHSGVEVEIPDAAAAFRFREGKIVWLLATDRVDLAREAVGLTE